MNTSISSRMKTPKCLLMYPKLAAQGKEENHLDVEYDEEQREAVEPEVELAPPAGECLETAFVDALLNCAGHLGTNL